MRKKGPSKKPTAVMFEDVIEEELQQDVMEKELQESLKRRRNDEALNTEKLIQIACSKKRKK